MTAVSGRKPVGGVRRVLLCGAGAVTGWMSGGGEDFGLLLEPGARLRELPLVEERSSYAEEVAAGGIPPAVRHTLRLVLSGWQGQELVDGPFLRQAAAEGFVAVVEAEDGRRFLVGRSLRLGGEQPLRIDSSAGATGDRRTEAPETVIVLRCTDDAPAMPLNSENR